MTPNFFLSTRILSKTGRRDSSLEQRFTPFLPLGQLTQVLLGMSCVPGPGLGAGHWAEIGQ